jgi:predicted lipoprotein with Yx(FWY)xxD motif
VPPDAKGWAQLQKSKAGALNPVLVDADGMTLYRFDKDANDPAQSNCDGECAATWPPVTVAHNGRIFVAGVEKSDVGTVRRADGFLQVTVGGWPVYRHVNDKKPGDAKGQGAGNAWFGVTPTGQKAGTGAQESNPAVTLYDGPGFSEQSQDVKGKGCQNLPRAKVTSSVSASGWVTLWSEKGCTGRSLAVNGKVPDLTKARFDNTVVSVSFD